MSLQPRALRLRAGDADGFRGGWASCSPSSSSSASPFSSQANTIVATVTSTVGLFSNEAGLGSAPNAGATAAVTHPMRQGVVQTLGVYFDTFLVCSITAFMILVSTPELTGAKGGIALTFDAVTGELRPSAGLLLCRRAPMLSPSRKRCFWPNPYR